MSTIYTLKCQRHGEFKSAVGPTQFRKKTGKTMTCGNAGCIRTPRLVRAETVADDSEAAVEATMGTLSRTLDMVTEAAVEVNKSMENLSTALTEQLDFHLPDERALDEMAFRQMWEG